MNAEATVPDEAEAVREVRAMLEKLPDEPGLLHLIIDIAERDSWVAFTKDEAEGFLESWADDPDTDGTYLSFELGQTTGTTSEDWLAVDEDVRSLFVLSITGRITLPR